ncbi:MAG: hypothetical protein JXR63_09415 [Spirochaetales bacterium]|nr:hypothetical protein [Spirochaetales bacterium]
MADLQFEVNCLKDSKIVELVRQIISDWGNSIPHHNLVDFGNKIELLDLVYRPCYFMTLTTQYEGRSKRSSQRPYLGDSIEKQVVYSIDEFNSWDRVLPESEGYEKKSSSFVVAGSEHVEDCGKCHASGKITCPSCGGKGKETCGTCKGKGEIRCSSCSGTGQIRCSSCSGSGYSGYQKCSACGGSGQVYRNNGNTAEGKWACMSCGGSGRGARQRCSRCHGTGKLTCTSCHGHGKNTCSTCRGSGILVCKKCNGQKVITCPTCDGKTQLVHYYAIDQYFSPIQHNPLVAHPKVRANFPDFTIDYNEEPGIEILTDSVDGVFKRNPLSGTPIAKLFDKMVADSEAETPFDNRIGKKIVRQHLILSRVNLYDVIYKFEDKEWELLILGSNNRIMSNDSPFLKLSQSCLENAKKSYKLGKIGRSMDFVEAANEMDLEGKRYEELNEFYHKCSKRFNRLYRLGAVLGGVASVIPLFYLIFGIAKQPHFIFSSINQLYSGEFVYFHSFMLFLLSTIFIASLNNRFYHWMVRRYDLGIRNEVARFSVAFISSVVNSLLVGLVVILFSSSGIALLFDSILFLIKPLANFAGSVLVPFLKILGV